MNYEEMSDFEINKAVLGVLSDFPVHPKPRGEGSSAGAPVAEHSILHWHDFCNSWSDAGPILVSSKIWIREMYGSWQATGFPKQPHKFNQVSWSDPNPLRALSVVFLMMQESKDE